MPEPLCVFLPRKLLPSISRGLRQFFRRKSRNQVLNGHGHASQMMAAHLSHVENSSFIWCSCGDYLKPIVRGNGDGVEVVALSCLDCGGTIPVNVGVLIDGNAE